MTLGEIQAGIELTREQDPDKARALETWLDQVSQSFNILPMDSPAFRCWVHQLTVVTRNTRDFQAFGVALLNPFEAG